MSEIMFRARTLEQIAVAWEVRSAYLRAHPDDAAILEEGESLWMREQALKYPDAPAPQAEHAAPEPQACDTLSPPRPARA